MQNLVILGRIVLEIYDGLTLLREQRRRRPTDPIEQGRLRIEWHLFSHAARVRIGIFVPF